MIYEKQFGKVTPKFILESLCDKCHRIAFPSLRYNSQNKVTPNSLSTLFLKEVIGIHLFCFLLPTQKFSSLVKSKIEEWYKMVFNPRVIRTCLSSQDQINTWFAILRLTRK